MDDQSIRYRQSIDNIDAALVYMLAERFKVTKAVGELKATIDLPPADPGREARPIERLRRLAREANLDPEFSEKLDRKSAVSGKSVSVRVDLGGRRILKKKTNTKNKQQ